MFIKETEMTNPSDSQDVRNIAPQEIMPLIKGDIAACVINLEERPEFGAPANNELSLKTESSSVFIEEFKKGCAEHIEELARDKATQVTLLSQFIMRADTLLNNNPSSNLTELLKKEILKRIARIKEYDQCIALVENESLKRERELSQLSITLAAEEQNPESKLVAFVPAKPNFSLSRNSNTFFAAHRKAPEKPSTPTDTLTPSLS